MPEMKEQRRFVRINYTTPLAYKVCKRRTIHNLLNGYVANISQAGLLCNIRDKVRVKDILWLSFDRATLSICEGVEKRSLIYQNGIIGKVVRVERKNNQSYAVGIQFLTREEKNLSHIYPKIYFLKKKRLSLDNLHNEPDETEDELEEQLEET
jgi:hypothetical protein